MFCVNLQHQKSPFVPSWLVSHWEHSDVTDRTWNNEEYFICQIVEFSFQDLPKWVLFAKCKINHMSNELNWPQGKYSHSKICHSEMWNDSHVKWVDIFVLFVIQSGEYYLPTVRNDSHVKWVEEVCNPFDGPGYQLNVLPNIKVWSI